MICSPQFCLSRVFATLISIILLASCDDGAVNKDTAIDAGSVVQASAGQVAEAGTKTETEKANDMFERFFEEWVDRSPAFLTALGRKKDNDKWDNLSEAYSRETLEMHKRQLAELQSLDVSQLDDDSALSYELMQQELQNEIDDYRWRLHDYPVDQMNGVHSYVPSLLINQHGIDDFTDAKAYIARVKALPAFFDQLIDGIERRTKLGVVPPKFVFAHVIRDSQNIMTGVPFDDSGKNNALVEDFAGKLDALVAANGLDGDKREMLTADLNAALLGSLKPAYQKLIDHLTELEKQSTADAGVWKWPDGDEFFKVALKRTTTTDLSAEDIHQIGLSEVERIHDEMRAIKEKVGFDGDLAAFMNHMRESQEFYYSSDAAGKERYLKEATALIDAMSERLDEVFIRKPKAALRVKAVEAFREQSAGKAFYQRPSEDGSRPGIYYANLYDMKSMPSYQMEALAYHEGVPGHHMQLAIAQELQGVPKFRKLGGYTAYTEGWGLYSEMLPKEIGFYQDPYSDFGRLAMELWRACRLVVDTGIHSKKWTREQGIAYYVDNTPNAEWDAIKMVERHIVYPSQATAYKVGMMKIIELREEARATMGEAFDIRQYHDQVLKFGPLPLDVLERKVRQWSGS